MQPTIKAGRGPARRPMAKRRSGVPQYEVRQTANDRVLCTAPLTKMLRFVARMMKDCGHRDLRIVQVSP